jgi:glycosyltransferase involved in cell wall biosynthesis
MKILVYSKYNRLGASSRLRTMQFTDKIKDHEFIFKPLFSDKYVLNLYKGKSKQTGQKVIITIIKLFLIFESYLSRLLSIFFLKKFDLLIIEKELFPYLPTLFYWPLFISNKPYIVDYDDAIFFKYKKDSLAYNKIKNLLIRSKSCTVGNLFLYKCVKNFGAKNILLIPTVVDLEKYKLNSPTENEKVTIGWIGTNSTVHYVDIVLQLINELSKNNSIKLITIGASLNSSKIAPTLEYEFFEWSEYNEVNLLNKIDIGIMPLNDTDWEKGKCAYKLIQYMALSKATVSSKIGANIEVLENNPQLGLLSDNSTNNEWKNNLQELISSRSKRKQMGQKARVKIEEEYSLSVWLPKYIKNLENVIDNFVS